MRIFGTIKYVRTGLIIGLVCAVGVGAAARITSLELKSGGRGLALVLNGDAEFPADAVVPATRATGSRYTVTVMVPQAVCGMRLRHFTTFPEGSPVSDIVVKEKPSSAVEIVVSMAIAPDKSPIVKNKEMRQLILISSRACTENEWLSASVADVPSGPAAPAGKPLAPAKPEKQEKPLPAAAALAPATPAVPIAHQSAPAPADEASATTLRDIAILQRGDVAQIMLNLNGPFSYELKTGKMQITLSLPAVTNGLGASSFKIVNSPVTGITLKAKKYAGFAGCSVVFVLEPGTTAAPYAIESANRLIIMVPVTVKKRFLVWSAVRNEAVSAEWTIPPASVPPLPAPAAAPVKTAPVKTGNPAEAIQSVIPTVQPSVSAVGSARNRGSVAGIPGVPGAATGIDTAGAKPMIIDSVRYTSYGRDPFIPYMMDNDPTLPSVDNLKLVGVLFSHSDRIVLLQDRIDSRRAYALRELDLIKDGSVMRINRTNVIFLLTEMGISRTFSLELPGDNTIVKTY